MFSGVKIEEEKSGEQGRHGSPRDRNDIKFESADQSPSRSDDPKDDEDDNCNLSDEEEEHT